MVASAARCCAEPAGANHSEEYCARASCPSPNQNAKTSRASPVTPGSPWLEAAEAPVGSQASSGPAGSHASTADSSSLRCRHTHTAAATVAADATQRVGARRRSAIATGLHDTGQQQPSSQQQPAAAAHRASFSHSDVSEAGCWKCRRKWSLCAENGRSEPQIHVARRGAVCQSNATHDAQGDFGRTATLGPRVDMAYATVVAGHST
jgi:hypothetical protein